METNRIKYSVIQQYLEGKLDPRDMHELEKQALEDPFLAEALEGYSETEVQAAPHLSLLQRQLDERIAQQQENKNTFFFTWQRLSIAAAAGLMFISAGILFWMKGDNRETRVAKHVEVKLTPVDSLYNEPEANDMASLQKEPVTVGSPSIEKSRPQIKKKSSVTPESVTLTAKPGDSRLSSVQIAADTDRLGEVVVVSHGSQSKKDITGAVSSADSSPRIMIRGLSSLPAGENARVASISLADNKTILGKVISKEDGSPLPGVSVRLEGTSKSVTTNVSGEFALADSVGGRISFAYIGYTSQVKRAQPGQTLMVEMQPQNSALSEVAVVGYGSAVKKQGKPVPAIGWKKYNEYLKNSVRSADGVLKGNVTLRFVVKPGGELSDFHIEKGLNEASDNEAIRIIKEGPSWMPGAVDSEARVTIKFN
ncbi:carboxypeptidase-like regulatory domain-containing protein [Arcticibacter tournemirensis]